MKNSKGYDFEKLRERNRRAEERRREKVAKGMVFTFGLGCVVFALMFVFVRLAQYLGISF